MSRSARWCWKRAGAPALLVAGVLGALALSPTAIAQAGCGHAHRDGGTRAGDRLIGTARDDAILGRGGRDVVKGRRSADCLRGGGQRDRIAGGPGHDRIEAGPGADVVRAADGQRDLVRCGAGHDVARVDRSDRVRGCERTIEVATCDPSLGALKVTGCRTKLSDTAAGSNPRPTWGSIDCQSESRYQQIASGGDPHPKATGAPQGNEDFRRLRVIDGDDVWGERCELGENWRRTGPTVLYHAGDRRITFFSERYPSDGFNPDINTWQTVMQMKQTQPADNAGQGPVLELQIYGGRLRLFNSWTQRWSTPAPELDTWIRYALDVKYSTKRSRGSVRVTVDLNGDGDTRDAGEESPRMHMRTLLRETDGPNGTGDGLAPGDPIPDHLRLGIYHDPSISCPAPVGCPIDIDNVQVVGGPGR